MQSDFQAIVVGGGPAGLTATVALAHAGIDTALVAPEAPQDTRTTALLGGSVAALQALGVWEGCAAHVAAISSIRIVDDRGGLLRAPEVMFDAAEIDLPAFGYNIENRALTSGLRQRIEASSISHFRNVVAQLQLSESAAELRLNDGTSLRAQLIVAADGRNSMCRAAAEIPTETWEYPQSALTCNLKHARSHENTSTEFHTRYGPFTLVPLPGRRSSLVWVTDPDEAIGLAEDKLEQLGSRIEQQAHSFLGGMQVEGERQVFKLSGLVATRFAGRRVLLVGEAAHVVPPIGAQGFNLGLRDVATVAELAAEAAGHDIGSPELLDRYNDFRSADVRTRVTGVDLLNRSLLTDFLPAQTLRGIGLIALQHFAPLRRAMMREGVAPRASEPRLMRGEPLRPVAPA